MSVLSTISPIDGSVIVERHATTAETLPSVLETASSAFESWRSVSLAERIEFVKKAVSLLDEDAERLGKLITQQMGRPIRYTAGEIHTTKARADFLLGVAENALAKVVVQEDKDFSKYLTHEPHGVVLIIFPWNYPFLCLINALVPALVSGNAVLLKPSPQTPLVSEEIEAFFVRAGLPKGVIQTIHSGDNKFMELLVQNPVVSAVTFTGSVAGGLAVQKAAADRTIPIGLELGGKDPAYVRADADLDYTAENVVDGAMFNSGQSCCSIERVYVHESVYDEFVKKSIAIVEGYKVGDPFDPETTIGPVVSIASAERIKKEVEEAIASGAKLAVPTTAFSGFETLPKSYCAPAVLVDCTDDMYIVKEETFGPVMPIVKVSSDEEAIAKMNDSKYGLTASIWTKDNAKGDEIASKVDAGTVFVNRADFPDPGLAWTGYKYSGRGLTLSKYGYDFFNKVKSHHVKKL
ncbi:hypothetical protein CANCADRAFT_132898 [Tortispora caseinolytica NRRL Y-17796]|uniref:Aldehyde dehydrogenase domain-containing protein n=1 Tax=Tortispora caseinolytica NRRL Y-17796 TaxID=767744 RepID=A0A1E4TB95_9ASCO|nr:hypothetical protein CANCADRAFT_132898 [Tortispora caseinolytica NRRL Y-17796]